MVYIFKTLQIGRTSCILKKTCIYIRYVMLFKTSFNDQVFKILDTNSFVFHFVYVQFWFICVLHFRLMNKTSYLKWSNFKCAYAWNKVLQISCNLVRIWIILFQKLHYTYRGLQFYKVVRYIHIYLFELIITICRHLSFCFLDACSGIKCDLELYLASRITFSMRIRQKQN